MQRFKMKFLGDTIFRGGRSNFPFSIDFCLDLTTVQHHCPDCDDMKNNKTSHTTAADVNQHVNSEVLSSAAVYVLLGLRKFPFFRETSQPNQNFYLSE